MMLNSFGQVFRLTTFGESHGAALGCVVDGCPAGVPVDEERLRRQLARRRPGQSDITTSRSEADEPVILSGVYLRKTLGTPIAMAVYNHDARSGDYETIRTSPRPGHADAAWREKFGHVDHRGGGRSSGRETVARVLGGWVAEELLRALVPSMSIVACVSQVGELRMSDSALGTSWTREEVDHSISRCPEGEVADRIETMLREAKTKGDSYGGVISLRVSGIPAGLGEPVFLKLHSYLAAGLASIGTINGIWWNSRPLDLRGSAFHSPGNTYGGISGGISTGSDLLVHIAGKPVSTIGDLAKQGRHDPCILPRAVPVVESMAALVLADLWLLQRIRRVELP
jgi:chorismate synthase